MKRSRETACPQGSALLRVAAVVRRPASGVTIAATSKPKPFDELTVCDALDEVTV